MNLPDPTGYGRVLRDPDGLVTRIVEHRDASPAELAVTEVNTGMYVLPARRALEILRRAGHRQRPGRAVPDRRRRRPAGPGRAGGGARHRRPERHAGGQLPGRAGRGAGHHARAHPAALDAGRGHHRRPGLHARRRGRHARGRHPPAARHLPARDDVGGDGQRRRPALHADRHGGRSRLHGAPLVHRGRHAGGGGDGRAVQLPAARGTADGGRQGGGLRRGEEEHHRSRAARCRT